MRRPLISMNFFSPNGFAPRLIDILLERFSGLPGRRCISHDEYHVNRGIVLAIDVERRVAAGASMDDGVGHAGASQAVAFLSPGRIRKIEEGFVSRLPDRENIIDMLSSHGLAKHGRAPQDTRAGAGAKIVRLEHAWRSLGGRNDERGRRS